ISARKWLIWLSYAGVISVIGFLILLNIPGTPLGFIKSRVGRLGQIFDTKEPASRVRLMIWDGVVNMVKSDHTRAVIGYGPEAMFVPYHKYASPELVRAENRIAFPDRSHNELFDTVITNGLIGGAVYIVLFGIIIFYALRWLGLVRNKTDYIGRPLESAQADDLRPPIVGSNSLCSNCHTIILIALLTIGAVSGILLPYLLFGAFTFAAVAVPLGLVSGSALYLFYIIILSPIPFIPKNAGHPTSRISHLVFIALFSAIIGHFVETQFGIALTGTRTYFYLFCAILLVMMHRDISAGWHSSDLPVPSTAGRQTGDKSWSPHLVTLLILSVFAYNLINTQPSIDTSNQIFRASVLLLLTGLSFYLFIGNPARLAVMFGLCGLFILGLSLFLPPLNSPINAIVVFSIWLAINMLVMAWFLVKDESSHVQSGRGTANIPLYLTLIIAAVIFIYLTNINPLRGNTLYKIGSGQEKQKNYDTALKYYDDALKLSADKSYYYASIARIYMEKYQRETDLKQRLKWYEECNKYLVKSIEYDRLSPTRNANMGRLYRVWARDTAEPKERAAKFAESHKYYQIATALTPSNPSMMNEWGEVYYEQGDTAKAIAKYEASIKITADFSETYAHLGDVYLGIKDEAKALANYLAAAQLHQKWLDDLRDPNQEVIYLRANQYLVQKQPDNYLGYFNLIYYYWQKGQRKEMHQMAQKARSLAPPEIQKRIDEFLSRLPQ
ncbi:MAG: tetratricopeptide repeat protein, partial [Planctomycetes bacterium]|nr:tetratricopeptide repeat protein [Planctomycetota bacterium]